jgi:ribonucleotide reductase alpha subunit
MLVRTDPSPFIDPAAVDVWDTWFRLRENGQLRDVSVEATWERVARELAKPESALQTQLTARLLDAQSNWQIVLDERILAAAGTPRFAWPADPIAVLNAAAFVGNALTDAAHFQFDAFRATAELAEQILDNTLLLNPSPNGAHRNLGIGIIGIGDAVALLGKRYDSAAGRVLASRIAKALAEGCFAANVRLARDRGAMPEPAPDAIDAAAMRGMPADLLDCATRYGLRRATSTAITSQRRLARFANNVADALDPLDDHHDAASKQPAVSRVRMRSSCGYAFALARRIGVTQLLAAQVAENSHGASVTAQIALRGAVQPWIDAPIDYPFRITNMPDDRSAHHWQQLARANHLGGLTLALESS